MFYARDDNECLIRVVQWERGSLVDIDFFPVLEDRVRTVADAHRAINHLAPEYRRHITDVHDDGGDFVVVVQMAWAGIQAELISWRDRQGAHYVPTAAANANVIQLDEVA